MPRLLHLELSDEQLTELEQVRDHQQQAYLREKAAALLKIAGGQVSSQVAQHGLLKARDTDTVYEWVTLYRLE